MKLKIFLLFALAFFAFGANAQSGTFIWTNGAPTAAPPASGAQFAVDRATFRWYEWGGSTWLPSGDRIQNISGCSTPNYTPGNHQSRVVINGCTPVPELYSYTGSAWVKLNSGTTYTAGAGINISGTTISADTAVLATQYDLSQVGVSWPLLAPDGSDGAPSYSFSNYPTEGVYRGSRGIEIQSNRVLLRGFDRIGEAANNMEIIAGSSDTEVGGNVSLRSGNGAQGGGFELLAGDGTLDGGIFTMQAGNGSQGGGFSASAGNSSGSGTPGGDFTLLGGSSLTGLGGGVLLLPGNFNTATTGVISVEGPLRLGRMRTNVRDALAPGIVNTAVTIYNTNATANDGGIGVPQTYTVTGWKSLAYDVSPLLAGTGNRLAILNSSGQFQRGTTDPANLVAVSGPTTGQIPKWNGSAWVPANDSIGGGGGTYTAGTGINITGTTISNTGVLGSGTAGRIPFFSLSQTIGNSGLTWDAVNNRLGVNQAAPTAHLHVESLASGNGRAMLTLRNPNATTTEHQYVTMGIGQAGGGPTNGQFVISRGTQNFGGGNTRDALIIDEASNVSVRDLNILNRRITSSNNASGNSAGNYFEIGKSGAIGSWTLTAGDVNIITTPVLLSSNPSNHQFAPTSGNANFTVFNVNPTLNQTGTANGTMRGFRYNPTTTSVLGAHYAATFSSGQVGIGTDTPVAGAQLEVKSTTGVMVPPNMTSTQRDAIVSPPNGIIYNTTTGKFQGYAAGAWVDLH